MREYMRGLHWHSREYRKIFLRDLFPHISQILEGIHSGANTCRTCICTHANTGHKFLANYLCIGFMPGGTPLIKGVALHPLNYGRGG